MKNFLVSGILAGLAITAVSFIADALIVQIWPYDVFSLAGIRSQAAPEMLLFFLSPFVLGLAMAYAYQYFNLKGKWIEKGQKFGIITWLIYGLTSTVITFSSMDYPTGFYISTFFGSLLYMLAAGIVIAKFSK